MSRRSSYSAASLLLCFSMLIFPAVVLADGWDDLWLTPDQQKRRLVEQGDFEALSASEDAAWSGVGHYKQGSYKEAAKAFDEIPGISGRYNAATSLIHAGEYQEAIDKLNQVLEEQPDHEKARHNLDVAQQLIELQEPPPQEGQDGESDGQQDQQNQKGEDQQSRGDENSGDQQESDQQGDSDTSDGADNQSESAQDQPGSDQSESEQNQDSGSNDVDQEQQEEQQNESSDSEERAMNQADAELSEDQQATEQWLRRIPDDPTGLLRRKLRRSHQSEYPTTTDSRTPW